MRRDIKMRHTTPQAAELQSRTRLRARIAVEHRDYRSKSPGSTPAFAPQDPGTTCANRKRLLRGLTLNPVSPSLR